MIEKRVICFGSSDFPYRERVGAKSLWVIDAPESGQSYIVDHPLQPSRPSGLSAYSILAEGRALQATHFGLLRRLVNNPMAYYTGSPIYKRLPPSPNFCILLKREAVVLDLMIDLLNAGWGFHCGDDHYEDWNWVGGPLQALAKSLFPELASPSPRSMWKRGAIESLRRTTRQAAKSQST